MSGQSMLNAFLREILQSVRARNGHQITDLIQLDFDNLNSSRQKPYADLNAELNARYPSANDAALSELCKNFLPRDELGSFHSSFSESIIQYFRYLRDFTLADILSKALEIRQLTSQCITALGDSKYGVIMIPIVLSFSRVLAKIATNLDRNPALLKQSKTATASTDETGGSKVSFVEATANVLRDAFIKCLAGSPGTSRNTRPAPDDKRYGIYLTANSCLKLLWQCRKLRNAQQMFLSIDAQSPPLSFYPAAQRVTYLYYLGRYHFANNHFVRAQQALQSAYDQCHKQATKHRRLILIYLITSNMCLGRFPSAQLFKRTEAQDLGQYFQPLCRVIKCGNLAGFYGLLDLSLSSTHACWFLQRRVLLQLRDRCEILVWRNLIRRIFLISGYKGEDKKIPFLRLGIVETAVYWVLNVYGSTSTSHGNVLGTKHSYIDCDFEQLDTAINETGFSVDSGTYHDDLINQKAVLSDTMDGANDEQPPSMYEIESVFLSLIQQGFLRGFLLHNPGNPRFAIPGSQAAGGPVRKGFPDVWQVVQSKSPIDEAVPGWVKDGVVAGGAFRSGAPTLGGVVRLSGARAVGVGS